MADLAGRTLGEFVLREQIGEGGYGAVYRSEQPALKRDVVVKVLHQGRHSDGLAPERFLREAQLASRLNHPYAAHVYAFGVAEEDGLQWIAMELVHGITLNDWLKAHGAMPLEQFVPFFECVAEVVHAAHERGIVHRDLKPSNMMVIERAGRLFPKLLDFGIAKSRDGLLVDDQQAVDAGDVEGAVTVQTRGTPTRRVRRPRPTPATAILASGPLTRTGAGFGSRAYMSPEQWNNAGDVGPATDIYSLGIVAYEALTGRVPFNGDSTDEYYRQHCSAEVPRLGGNFSTDVDRVIRRALSKYPEHRQDSAVQLASEMRAALRASEREQLRSSAQQWDARDRPDGLLWRGQTLADLERWIRRVPSGVLSELEFAFVTASRRHAQRSTWIRRSLVALAAAAVLAGIQYRTMTRAEEKAKLAQLEARMAQELVTQGEVEQGRQTLLQGDAMEAQVHLAEAYRRGERSPETAFMLARALQPGLAEQARFVSTSGNMWSARFSPDGRQIVTTDDRTAQLWDATTNRLLFTLPHDDIVYDAVYSADGTMLVSAGGDAAVKIWNAASGALVRELKHNGGRPARYFVVGLSPDGKFVAAIDTTGAVAHVWDMSSGAVLAELSNDGTQYPSLAFSADGRWIATGGGDDVRVFDTMKWTRVLTIPGPRIRTMSFGPTAPQLATGAAGGDAAIWSIPQGARIRHLREVGEPVDRVAFSPSGELVVTASRDGTEQIWNARSGALQGQANHLRGRIQSVEFDRTSTLVLAAGAMGTVVVADVAQGMAVATLEGARAAVRVAHFDPTSRRVVGASLDGAARVWDATPPYRRWSSPPISDDCGLMGGVDPDHRYVAVGCRGNATRVWDTARDQLLAELPSVTQVEGDFTSAFPAVSAAGDRAAIARGNTVEIYALPGGKLLRTIAHGAAVNAVAFAPTGRAVVSGAIDGSLLVTDDGHTSRIMAPAGHGIDAAAILADGRVVASAGEQLRVYEADRDSPLATMAVPTRVGLLRPSPDGHRLITIPLYARKAAPPVLWDIEGYRRITQLEGHVGRVFSARFVAEGAILTAGIDGTARLWNGTTGQLRKTFRGRSRFLVDATMSPDGSMVAAGDADGMLRFWGTASGRPLWILSAHKSYLVGLHFEGDDIVTRGFAGDVARWTLPKPEQVFDECGKREACAIVR
jgi:eukaryotic-like serine/threonine-protein kinase